MQGYLKTCRPLWKKQLSLKLLIECHLSQVIEQELKQNSQYRNIWKELLTLWILWLLAMKRIINYIRCALYKNEL